MNTDKRMRKLLREAVRLSERIDMLRREVYGKDCLDVREVTDKAAYWENGYQLMTQRCNHFEARAGVPLPCPKCGAYVEINKGADPAVNEDMFWVECSMYFSARYCRYETSLYDTAEDAWREHERNCQKAEEGEG